MFWLKSCWIVIFCLLQFSIVMCILCMMTVNFLWLIFAVWFMIKSQTESYSSFFLITIMLVMIRMFSLSSCLAVIILFVMKLFFILFMLSTTCDISWLQSEAVLSEQIMISFLIRHIRMSCSCDSFNHIERFFCRIAV